MDYLSLITIAGLFVFGLIIGSFLNVVILRFNTGMTVSKGRSACFSCGKTLSWYELVPLASFFAQQGRCRGCHSKISWQYPLVELAGGCAFVIAYFQIPAAFTAWLPLAVFALLAAILCLYIVMTVYDIRHKVIPDGFSYGAGVLALGLIAVQGYMVGFIAPSRLAAGALMFLFFWFFWFVSRGTWMGLGDGKLALSMGWVLGLSKGLAALLLSFWVGAILSILALFFQRLLAGKGGKNKHKLGLKSAIPFGPFLMIGFLIVLIWHLDVQTILSYLAL